MNLLSMNFHKIWNGHISGLFSAVLLLVAIVFRRIVEKIKSILFKSNIASCGKKVRVMSGFEYRCPSKITVGSNVIIGRNSSLSTELFEDGGTLSICDGVTIGNECTVDYTGGVVMEDNSHLAHGVLVLTHHHGMDYHNKPIGKPLCICESAFVGSRSIILHNCSRIGKKAIVGSGSVVTKDVPDFAIVAGNPAKIIGKVELQ